MFAENYPNKSLIRSSSWTHQEEKIFERALVEYGDALANPQELANCLGKSVDEIQQHYNELLNEINEIECGNRDYIFVLRGWRMEPEISSAGDRIVKAKSDGEKRKAAMWTEEEHRRFLYGLKKYGKGDWRNISRHVVVTKTPTQVASHAQKYFIRQKTNQRKRSSIHDITTVDDEETVLNIDKSQDIASPVSAAQQPFPMQYMSTPPPRNNFPNHGGYGGYQNDHFHM